MWRITGVVKGVYVKYPVLRGMTTFSVLWPLSNSVQQMLDKAKDSLDLKEIGRYSFFGTFVVAPTLYYWMKFVGVLVPGNRLKHLAAKLVLEAAIFGPLGQTQFLLGINLLEGRTWEESLFEWKRKLFPTWKSAALFWPAIQALNYTYVPLKNRVVVVSLGSFVWIIFLSYMHHSKGAPPSLLSTIKQVTTKQERDSSVRCQDVGGVSDVTY